MKVMVVVINDDSYLDPLLELFSMNKVLGGTIIDSQGLYSLRFATHPNQLPIFAPLSNWGNDVHPGNKTIFSVIDDDKEDSIMKQINDLFNGFTEQGKGIVFTVDVSKALGVKINSIDD